MSNKVCFILFPTDSGQYRDFEQVTFTIAQNKIKPKSKNIEDANIVYLYATSCSNSELHVKTHCKIYVSDGLQNIHTIGDSMFSLLIHFWCVSCYEWPKVMPPKQWFPTFFKYYHKNNIFLQLIEISISCLFKMYRYFYFEQTANIFPWKQPLNSSVNWNNLICKLKDYRITENPGPLCSNDSVFAWFIFILNKEGLLNHRHALGKNLSI